MDRIYDWPMGNEQFAVEGGDAREKSSRGHRLQGQEPRVNGRDDAPRNRAPEGGLRDRARGVFVGLAVSDAIGMPAELKEPGEFESVGSLRTGGPFDLPAGHWTGDTSMTLYLAGSLLACGGYDSYDVMDRYRRRRRKGYRSSTGVCFDIGNQVAVAISEFKSDPWVPRGKSRVLSADNGSIMRLAPAIVAAFGTRRPKSVIEAAEISAREAHYSVEAEAGTELFAAILVRAMEGADKLEICSPRSLSTGEQFDTILNRVVGVGKLENTGYIVHSLQVAAWAFASHESLRDGMFAAVNLGGDSDTNGTIHGQLAGAYYGYEAIPRMWRDGVFMASEIAALADDLLAMEACLVLWT